MKKFTEEKAKELAIRNCQDLQKILRWNMDKDIRFMRVSSDLLPFADHPELGWGIGDPGDLIPLSLQACQFYTESGNRLTTHPGPYTVLSSENPKVVAKSIKTMVMHYWIGYFLYANYRDMNSNYVANIHVGRNFSEKVAKKFCQTVSSIDPEVQKIITVENDDKPNGWTVQKLKKYIYDQIGIPIVFDAHHHRFCNEGEPVEEALEIALSTWPKERKPKVHYSESRPDARPQAHSDLVKSIPSYFEGLDVIVEAKLKEQAIMPFIQ